MFKFERLEVWKKSVEFAELMSDLANQIPQRDQFSLGEQVRRASLSISANIAEGTGRENEKESRYFYTIAKGSTYESVSLLSIMEKRGYITKDEQQQAYLLADEIARMLTGLIKKNL